MARSQLKIKMPKCDCSRMHLLIEFLRYAGKLKCQDSCDYHNITIPSPSHVPTNNTRDWAESQVKRIKSFGIEAEIV